MKKVENKFKQYMNKNLKIKDCYKDIESKIDFNDDKERNMSRKSVFAITGGVLAFGLVAGVGFTLLNGPKDPIVGAPKAIVSVDVNPNIDLLVDEENRVVSVTGNNDDGKMILVGEVIVGKTLDEALEIIIKAESDTGFLIKGNVEATENNIEISVSANSEEVANTIKTSVTNSITSICDELNINETIETVQKYSDEVLKEMAVSIDPTLEEKVDTMTKEELLEVIAKHQKETAQIYSDQLADLYTSVKNYKLDLVEKEEVQNVLTEVDAKYQEFVQGYSSFVDSLSNQHKTIETLRYNLLVDEDSLYQQSVTSVNDAKKELQVLKQQIADEENEISKAILEAGLSAKEAFLDTVTNTLASVEEGINTQLDQAHSALDTIIAELEKIEEELPEEIKTDLESNLEKLENNLNTAKDSFFEEFETKYKDDINKAKEEAEARKQALIEALKNK